MSKVNTRACEKWVVNRYAALHQLVCGNSIAGVKDQLLGMAIYIIHSWTKQPCTDVVAYYREDGDIDVFTKSYMQLFPEVFL